MSNAMEQSHGRMKFLEAAARLEPRILEDLKAGPLQVLLRLKPEWDVRNPLLSTGPMPTETELLPRSLKALAFAEYLFEQERIVRRKAHKAWSELTLKALDLPKWSELREQVLGWAVKWHVNEKWCIEQSLHTLVLWVTRNVDRWPLDWPLWHAWKPNRYSRLAPTLKLEAWDPRVATETQYKAVIRQEVKSQLEKKLKEHCDAIRVLPGFSEPQEIRSPEKFLRLAGFQINGWSYENIADAENLELRTVEQQIQDLGGYIGLTLRDRSKSDFTQTGGRILAAMKKASRRR
jgi:hypothetical protein